MPKPREGESHDEYMERCVPVVIDDGTARDREQAVAVCNSMWDEHQDEGKQVNDQLIKSIASRKGTKNSFGYGITTADRYARMATDDKTVISKCAGRLVYCNEDMILEKAKRREYSDLLPEGIAAPKNTLMVLQHVVTTPREDRDKDILRTEGAMLDPKAPLLWQHMPTLPIGKVLATIQHDKKVLRVATALIDMNELTEDAAKLIEADVLRFSHGFRALEFEQRKEGDDDELQPGFDIRRFEIFEVSLVSVPSNVDAQMELFARKKMKSEEMKRYAKRLMEQRPVQVVSGMECDAEGRLTAVTYKKLRLGDSELYVPCKDDNDVKTVGVGFVQVHDNSPPKEKQEIKQMADETKPEQTHEEEPETKVAPVLANVFVINNQDDWFRFQNDEAKATGVITVLPDYEQYKAGRVISERNLSALKEVKSDLEELASSDMKRSQKALCERCISRIESVIKSAEREDKEDEKPEKEKPDKEPQTVSEAISTILCNATPAELKRTMKAIDGLLETHRLDELGNEYRQLVGT